MRLDKNELMVKMDEMVEMLGAETVLEDLALAMSSNEEGDPVDNLENVPGYYLDDYSNSENVYLNEYMKKNYNATLAKFDVVYHK